MPEPTEANGRNEASGAIIERPIAAPAGAPAAGGRELRRLATDLAHARSGTTAYDAALEAIVAYLAEAAVGSQYPGRSIAAYTRHHLDGVLSPLLLDAVRVAARTRARRARAGSAPGTPARRGWWSLEENAAMWGIGPRRLAADLHDSAHRRFYGWPEWRGGRWWFSAAHNDPATRASALGSLPHAEPHRHLPPWCKPAGGDAAPTREAEQADGDAE